MNSFIFFWYSAFSITKIIFPLLSFAVYYIIIIVVIIISSSFLIYFMIFLSTKSK